MFIGIDCGLSGAICTMKGDDIAIMSMPINVNKEGERKLDLKTLKSLFTIYKTALVGIEYAPPGAYDIRGRVQGVGSVYKVGLNYGLLLGLMEGIGVTYEVIAAGRWQKHLLNVVKTGTTKARSLEKAKELYPNVKLIPYKGRVESHNFSDALLIAHYVKMEHQSQKGLGLYAKLPT